MAAGRADATAAKATVSKLKASIAVASRGLRRKKEEGVGGGGGGSG